MKLLKKALAVVMSLSLCVGMAAPAFAATFDDLQSAISDDFAGGNNPNSPESAGRDDNGNETYGYDKKEDGSFGIVAWDTKETQTSTEESGGVKTTTTTTRHVQLNDDVTYDGDKDNSPTITIRNDQTVELDLNGHSIESSSSDPVIAIAGGDPSLKDQDPSSTQAPGELTLTNSGSITGEDGGIKVGAGAELNIDGDVKISGGDEEESYDVLLEYDKTNDRGAMLKGGDWNAEEEHITDDSDGNKVVSSANAKQNLRLKQNTSRNYGFTDSGRTAEDTMTSAEFVNYIWEHEGKPEPESAVQVPSSQKYAEAVAWAQSISLIDDEVRLDRKITVSTARTILTRFAAWKGIEMPELAALTGKEEDTVRNCLAVLKEFFGEK